MPKLTKRQKEAAAEKRSRILTLLSQGKFTQAAIAKTCRCSQQYVSKISQDATKEKQA